METRLAASPWAHRANYAIESSPRSLYELAFLRAKLVRIIDSASIRENRQQSSEAVPIPTPCLGKNENRP